MIKAYLAPHPPLIVKGVGDGSEIPQTRAAYEKISREMQEYNPDTVVIISPHSALYADYFHISPVYINPPTKSCANLGLI